MLFGVQVHLSIVLAIVLTVLLFAVLVIKYLTYNTPNPDAKIKLSDPDPRHREKGFIRQDLSLSELYFYNGNNAKKNNLIFVAVDKYIFDVTIDKKLYGPDGCYSALAGRDASRSLATGKIDPKTFSFEYDFLSDLSPTQVDHLHEWRRQFSEKYQCTGKLIRPCESRIIYDEDEETFCEPGESEEEEEYERNPDKCFEENFNKFGGIISNQIHEHFMGAIRKKNANLKTE